MTYDEILAMTPAELRKAIAKAKGYECKHGFMDAACINPVDYWMTHDGCLTSVLPDWTTNIADAWKLMEEVQVESLEQAVFIGREVALSSDWHCCIGVHRSIAPTAAHAISRCWLMWKREQ